METKDIVALLINVLSVFAAVAAVIIARRAVGSQHHVQGWAVNHALLMPAILIMTTTYPISSLGGRIIRLSSLQDQLSNIKLMRCSQLSKQK